MRARQGTSGVVAEMLANRSIEEYTALAELAEKEDMNWTGIAIARAGGIEAMLAGMRAHGSSTGVQEQGCTALGNLSGTEENEAFRSFRFFKHPP
jgi:hypothetical protein